VSRATQVRKFRHMIRVDFFVNKLKGNEMINFVNKELVNKVNEVKALSLGLTPCNKLL